MNIAYDPHGNPVPLGRELGRGGEGAVFEIEGRPAAAAKIYHRAPDRTKVAKLRAMIAAVSPELLKFAGWPTTMLHSSPGGRVVGFSTPLFAGCEPIHHLYDTDRREALFPGLTWAFLVRVARNVASVFRRIHELGHVIGDVNEKNILVARDATVRLIDCDSFQVGGYPCEVGAAAYTPPELRGNWAGVARTADHDGFGLAVLIFQLLALGRHPYAGEYTGPGEMSLDRAMSEGLFAYGPDAALHGLNPPPRSLRLKDLPPSLSALFVRGLGKTPQAGFTRPSKTRLGGFARPGADEWTRELEGLERQLGACAKDPAHRYFGRLRGCPWCRIERQGAPATFASASTYFRCGELQSLERAIQAVAPPQAPEMKTPDSGPGRPITPVARLDRRDYLWAKIGTFAFIGLMFATLFSPVPSLFWLPMIVALLLGGWWALMRFGSDYGRERSRRLREKDFREREWQGVADELSATQNESADRFASLCGELYSLRDEFVRSETERARVEEELRRDPAGAPLRHWLRARPIRKLTGLGSETRALLRSFDVETALDLEEDRLRAIPGLGAEVVEALLEWRRQEEDSFRAAGSPQESPKIEAHRVARQREILDRLREGPRELQTIASEASRRFGALLPRAHETLSALSRAAADAHEL